MKVLMLRIPTEAFVGPTNSTMPRRNGTKIREKLNNHQTFPMVLAAEKKTEE